MKVTILQGSPRKKANTAQAAAWMTEELESLGHEVENVYLTGRNLNGCLACAKCKEKPEEIGCVQKDDVNPILEKIVASDLVVYASPLYFWGVTAQLKAVIDRTFSFYIDYHMPTHASLVDGKKQALLLTGGGPYDNNAEAAVVAYQRHTKPLMSVNAGELFLGGCKTPDALGDEQKAEVVAFTRKIVDA